MLKFGPVPPSGDRLQGGFLPASSLFSYEATQNRMQDPRIPKKVLTHNNVRPPYSWATGSSSRPSSRCSTRAAWPTWYVEEFYLQNNAISDAGMRELAAAVARGGLPKCTDLDLLLFGNPGSDSPVEAALARRDKKVLRRRHSVG